jgi:hypothetical protein
MAGKMTLTFTRVMAINGGDDARRVVKHPENLSDSHKKEIEGKAK